MDVYTLKMLLGKAIMPFSIVLLLCFISLILLIREKKQTLAKWTLGLSLLSLYALSTSYVADAIMAPLEYRYPAYKQLPNQPLSYIVVLGCGHTRSKILPSSTFLYPCSQVRLHEALRLYQLNPGAKIVFTGKSSNPSSPNETLAATMAEFALEVGIKAQDIIIESRPSDTIEEVALVSQLIADAPSAVVTSAAHIPRAMLLFERQGIDITPAPTDYYVHFRIKQPHLIYFMPLVLNLTKVDKAFHEYYGLLYLWLLGLRL
jgi:uncharacterized SAM-binding protein YcdF (DUF218 family)